MVRQHWHSRKFFLHPEGRPRSASGDSRQAARADHRKPEGIPDADFSIDREGRVMTRSERRELILCYVAQAFRRNPDDGQLFSTPGRVERAMGDLLADFEERECKPSLTYISPLRSRAA